MALAIIEACGEFEEMVIVANCGGICGIGNAETLVNTVMPFSNPSHVLGSELFTEIKVPGLLVVSNGDSKLTRYQSSTGALLMASKPLKSPVQVAHVLRPFCPILLAQSKIFVDLR